LIEDSGFIGDPARVRVLPGVPEALLALAGAGFARIVVTNQSGVARGMFAATDVASVNRELSRALAADGAAVDAFYVCPHLRNCDCRKPAPGLIRRAQAEHDVDLAASILFGDRGSDIALAAAVGIPGILVNELPGYDGPPPAARARTLLEGVRSFLDAVRA